MSQHLDFSYNWNGKLDCKVFTTLRLSGRLNVGDEVDVYLKQVKKGNGIVLLKYETTLAGITDGVAFIDTGYDAEKCRNILQKMYSNQVLTNSQRIYLYFIGYVKPGDTVATPQPTLF